MNQQIKQMIGKTLFHFCDWFPRTKPLLRSWGLRTSQEWVGARVLRVQSPNGPSFKLASVSQNYLSFELFWRGVGYYEPVTSLVLQQLARPGTTFIDIGANIGFYSLLLSVNQPRLHVIAFEPNPKNFQLLITNVSVNGLSQISCEPMALSDVEGNAVLYLSASDMSASLRPDFDFHPTDSVEVKTTTLDQYIAAARIQGPLVLKVDAEGNEEPVLRGARQTLINLKPDIIAEVALDYSSEAVSLLRAAGYRFFPITDQGLFETDELSPVVRGRLVFLNYLLTTKTPEEVGRLFARIADRVRQIDLKQTSKFLDPESLQKFKERKEHGQREPVAARA